MNVATYLGLGVGGLALGVAGGYAAATFTSPDFAERRASADATRTAAQDAHFTQAELHELEQQADLHGPSAPIAATVGSVVGGVAGVAGFVATRPRHSFDLSLTSFVRPASPLAKAAGTAIALAGVGLLIGSQVAAAQRRS
jgi:hypothetical protein